jgi:hypothetical protein
MIAADVNIFEFLHQVEMPSWGWAILIGLWLVGGSGRHNHSHREDKR